MNNMQIVILAACGLFSFGFAALLGKVIIPELQRLHFGQTIRDEGPAWHQKKQGTPTMGGIIFILSAVLTAVLGLLAAQLLLSDKPLSSGALWVTKLLGALFLPLGCGAIGFADDYIKVVKKRNLGLTAKQKLLAQLLVSVLYALSQYLVGATNIHVPFFGMVNFGLWYIPFCVFVIIAMSNATNLTDGVDGLCGSVSFVAVLPFIVLASSCAAFGLELVAVTFAGALAGFLVWNLHPAKVFMGDTGSLYIGAVLTALAFALNIPFVLVPVGIIYILENLSVILQVSYFKITKGKRLFKMSPLHHHFEMCGWKENTIVIVFSAVTLAGSVLAVLLML